MSVRYSTPHVHYPHLNSSWPINFLKFKCHIFICVCVSVLMNSKFLKWAYRSVACKKPMGPNIEYIMLNDTVKVD